MTFTSGAAAGRFVTVGKEATNDRIIDHRLFVDGVTRPVRLDAAGKQYVEADGERVAGVWVHPPEAPSDPPPDDQTSSAP
jgi:hypothetical protein